MIDQDFNSWLIEINTNPCIEESSELLKSYIPRLIDDALQLTVDVKFPQKSMAKPQKEVGGSSFPIDSLSNDKNVWSLLQKCTSA